MSESVHAVVSSKQSHHEHDIRERLVPKIEPVKHEISDDDDDDIDIIGKFDHNNTINSQTFSITAPSPSLGSSNYLLTNSSLNANHVHSNQYQRLYNFTPEANNFLPRINLNNMSTEYQTATSQNHTENVPDDSGTKSECNKNKTTNEFVTHVNHIAARDRLRRALHYQFLSPMDKWRIKSRFPWKLIFQIIKILLVTTQVILFGNNITRMQSVDNSILISLHNLFLKNWDSSRDFKSVPPDNGPYAVYTKDDFYTHIDYAIKNYANLSELSVGSFGYQISRNENNSNNPLVMSPIDICYQRYMNATLNPSTSEYYIEQNPIEKCITIDNLYPPGSNQWRNFSYLQFLQQNYLEQLDMQSLLQVTVNMPIRTILLDTLPTYNTPQCYDLDVSLNFDNKPHSGEISINMMIHNKLIACKGNLQDSSRKANLHNVNITINFIVLFLCLFSLLLCIRTLWRSQILRRRTERFFAVAYKRSLNWQASMHFIDGWILMIVLNDILLVIGSSINLLRKFRLIGPHYINPLRPIELDSVCSALLGVGNLLVWFGILRYLAFFNKYNILIVTIKHSLPRVMRFLFCVLVLYGGFCFSGWIILGPYHYKFYTLARTSECLFALMNGDDVFATFAYLQKSSTFVWWFCRLYLYSFVLLFIYIVMSLFIAILMDSYETIKDFYQNRNKKRIKDDFFMHNDILSRFLLESFENDTEMDTYSSFRHSLFNDEEYEHRNNEQTSNCCGCHRPNIFRTLFNSIRIFSRERQNTTVEQRHNLLDSAIN